MLTKSADLLDKLLERVLPAPQPAGAPTSVGMTDFWQESRGERVAALSLQPQSSSESGLEEIEPADLDSWRPQSLGAARLALIEAIGLSGLPAGIPQADGSLLLALRDRLGLVMFSRYDRSWQKDRWVSPAALSLGELSSLIEEGVRGIELRTLVQEQGASKAYSLKAQTQLHLRVGHASRELDFVEKQHREAVRAGRLVGRLLLDPHSVTPESPGGSWVLVLELDGLRARVASVTCLGDVATAQALDSESHWIDLRHWIG